MWEWRISSRVEASHNAEPVVLSNQSEKLLAILLATRNHPVDADTLTTRLWTRPPSGAPAALRVAVNRLRDQLGVDSPVHTVPAGYVLRTDADSVDLFLFEQLVDNTHGLPPTVVASRLQAALSLWRGHPFGSYRSEHWANPIAARLEELHRSVFDSWASISLDLGRHEPMIGALEGALLDEPFRERRWWLLMLALYRSNRQAEAVRAFERARATLEETLGIAPGRDLSTLLVQILNHDVRLDLESHMVPVQTSARIQGPLFGRGAQLRQVVGMLTSERCVALVGLGGIGKTALAHAVLAELQSDHAVVELASLTRGDQIPGALAASIGFNDDSDPATLTERVVAFLRSHPRLLLMDNCEHLEVAASELCGRLLRDVPDISILMTSRRQPNLAGCAQLHLPPLSVGSPTAPGAAAMLIAHEALIEPADLERNWQLISEIDSAAGGIPLALRLRARSLRVRSSSTQDPERSTITSVPPVSEAVLGAIRDLPDEVIASIQLLAELPDGFTVEFGSAMLNMGQRSLRYHIDNLIQRGLARPEHRNAMLRVHLIEPVRQQLLAMPSRHTTDRRPLLARRTAAIARTAARSPIQPLDRPSTAMLDDDRRSVEALLNDQYQDINEFLSVAADLILCWRHCGRIEAATALGTRARLAIAGNADIDQNVLGRALLAASIASPSFASRSQNLRDLQAAQHLAIATADLPLELRVTAELVQAHGWSGRLAQATELLDQLEARLPPVENPWIASQLRSLRALIIAAQGDPLRASQLLLLEAAEHDDVHPHQAMSDTYLAASLMTMAGAEQAAVALLRRASCYELDRFSALTHTKVAFELARAAVRSHSSDAESQLRRAAALLDQHGELRTALVCHRDLARHIANTGRIDEATQLLVDVVQPLLVVDPKAAAVALASLASLAGLAPRTSDAIMLASGAIQRADRSGGFPYLPDERDLIDSIRSLADPNPVDDESLISLLNSISAFEVDRVSAN